jgi:endogenous inhibitor of DNA gyrase (YacG/DUF329 family)
MLHFVFLFVFLVSNTILCNNYENIFNNDDVLPFCSDECAGTDTH